MSAVFRSVGGPSTTRRVVRPVLGVAKQQPTQREFYEEIHRVADQSAPRVRREFLDAIQSTKHPPPTLQELQAVVEGGSVAGVVAALGIGEKLGRALTPMAHTLRRVFEDAARATLEDFHAIQRPAAPTRKQAQLQPSLDLLNERSVEWLRNYQLDLISLVSIDRLGQDVRITPATIEGIREVIVNAFEQGGHPYQQARTIRNMIGLNARQARAVNNFRLMLQEEGVRPDIVKKRVDAYYTRSLNARAKMIARTETIRASNAGQQEAWAQASDQGLLDPVVTRRKWIITPDDRLCDICRAIPGMNPEGVRLREPFKTSVGPRLAPPAHPMCRCATGLIRP